MLNISIKAQRCKDFKMCLAPQRNVHFSKKQFFTSFYIQTDSFMNMIQLIKKALWFGQFWHLILKLSLGRGFLATFLFTSVHNIGSLGSQAAKKVPAKGCH
jgi:hypothetical protein